MGACQVPQPDARLCLVCVSASHDQVGMGDQNKAGGDFLLVEERERKEEIYASHSLSALVVAAGLVWCGSPTFALEAGQAKPPMHKHLMTTVEKVQSGLVFFKPTAGLQDRAVSVHKAERMGLNEAKAGDRSHPGHR